MSRDRHAELLTTLAILGGTLERIAIEIRHLQRTEVGEAFEPFGSGQQGSSAMPHKRNPILAERVTGMARLLRADALVGLENMALWHERDISHLDAERFVFERALGVAAYATRTTANILDGLEVDADRMRANLDELGGMVYSEALLLAMIAKGADRQAAYRIVQGAAKRAWAGETTSAAPCRRPGGCRVALRRRGRAAMDLEHHLAGIDITFRALDLDESARRGPSGHRRLGSMKRGARSKRVGSCRPVASGIAGVGGDRRLAGSRARGRPPAERRGADLRRRHHLHLRRLAVERDRHRRGRHPRPRRGGGSLRAW